MQAALRLRACSDHDAASQAACTSSHVAAARRAASAEGTTTMRLMTSMAEDGTGEVRGTPGRSRWRD